MKPKQKKKIKQYPGSPLTFEYIDPKVLKILNDRTLVAPLFPKWGDQVETKLDATFWVVIGMMIGCAIIFITIILFILNKAWMLGWD